MLLLIDECVPDSVAEFFCERGHEVRFVRDLFPAGTKDPVVAVGGDLLSAIIVTFDRDFKRLASRAPQGNRRALRNLGRISLSCNETIARRRIEELIDWIEFAHAHVQKLGDKRLIIEITTTTINWTR